MFRQIVITMILNDELNIGNILGILTELKNIKGTHPIF